MLETLVRLLAELLLQWLRALGADDWFEGTENVTQLSRHRDTTDG